MSKQEAANSASGRSKEFPEELRHNHQGPRSIQLDKKLGLDGPCD